MEAFARIRNRFYSESIFSVIFILFFLLISISCADSSPDISDVKASVVFDFADDNSDPSVRFSVFAQTDSDINRVSSVSVRHIETNQKWICNEPRKIANSKNKKWAGYTNFVSAEGRTLPLGKYEFVYSDFSERECEYTFDINYPESFLKSRSKDFPELIQGSRKVYLAIYNTDGLLIYYGENNKKWTSNDLILKDYPKAKEIRTCYEINGGKIICLMPIIDITNKQNNLSEENNAQ